MPAEKHEPNCPGSLFVFLLPVIPLGPKELRIGHKKRFLLKVCGLTVAEAAVYIQ
jgi:hypothetical protein